MVGHMQASQPSYERSGTFGQRCAFCKAPWLPSKIRWTRPVYFDVKGLGLPVIYFLTSVRAVEFCWAEATCYTIAYRSELRLWTRLCNLVTSVHI